MDATPRSIVIVGAGQAGSEMAAQLRQRQFDGQITLIGEEPCLPYHRPPLSKGFLAGEMAEDALPIRSAEAYARLDVTLRTGLPVDAIHRHSRSVSCGGADIGYDRLILATGGRARRLRVPGAELENIHCLRTVRDARALQPWLQPGRRLVIVGGGYVGLEVAAIAVTRGLEVTVLEGATRVLARVAAPEMSAFYTRVHQARGVRIRTGVAVEGFVAGDERRVAGVLWGADTPDAADLVIVGVGLIANAELAEAAGLVVDGGILVDEAARTNDPHIHAIGDCAVHAHHPFLQRQVRLESVPNAMEQARIAACAIMDLPVPVAGAPWFWSDQYDLKLQMVGLSEGHDAMVLRGSEADGAFTALYLKDGRVIAAECVNRSAEFMAAKRLVGERRRASAAALADETVPLKSVGEAVSVGG